MYMLILGSLLPPFLCVILFYYHQSDGLEVDFFSLSCLVWDICFLVVDLTPCEFGACHPEHLPTLHTAFQISHFCQFLKLLAEDLDI